MIIDLNLSGKTVIVIGGGSEAEKRINSLLDQKCKIIVISPYTTNQIQKLATTKKIILKKYSVKNTTFIGKYKPDIILCTTDDAKINQKILSTAKNQKILAYSSDNPNSSDFSNPAIIDFEKVVQIAIFTGGKSPAMSKKLRIESEKIFKKIISKEDIAQIKIQEIARKEAKRRIPSQKDRKTILHAIMRDKTIKQLIKDGKVRDAEKLAITLLREK